MVANCDNSDVNITGHATAATTIATSMNLGTGALTITGNGGAITMTGADVTAGSVTVTGSGAVSANTINPSNVNSFTTGSGADSLTMTAHGASITLNTGEGNDTIETDNAAFTALMTYTFNMGGGTGDTLNFFDGSIMHPMVQWFYLELKELELQMMVEQTAKPLLCLIQC